MFNKKKLFISYITHCERFCSIGINIKSSYCIEATYIINKLTMSVIFGRARSWNRRDKCPDWWRWWEFSCIRIIGTSLVLPKHILFRSMERKRLHKADTAMLLVRRCVDYNSYINAYHIYEHNRKWFGQL